MPSLHLCQQYRETRMAKETTKMGTTFAIVNGMECMSSLCKGTSKGVGIRNQPIEFALFV
eukprot:scaffold107943_cov19-Prasinocladus_malaysianus.AAC.1